MSPTDQELADRIKGKIKLSVRIHNWDEGLSEEDQWIIAAHYQGRKEGYNTGYKYAKEFLNDISKS